MPLTTLNGSSYFWAIWAPMAACGPSTSWSTALPMSWSRPPILAAMTSRADLRRDHRREVARLDRVLEHVLAVARPELEPAEGLEELAGQARHAAFVRGLLAGLADDEIDLGARLGHDLLDPAGVDPAVAHQLRERDPGDLAADRVEAREDDRLRRVVDDQVDPGGLLERADVAALAADDPALHLVVRQVDDGHGVLRGVVRGDALHRGQDDVAGLLRGLLAGPPLDRAGELDGVVLGLLADGLEEHALGVLGGHAADLLEGDDALLVELLELVAALVELDLLLEELPIPLLEHVRALVELLVARCSRRSRLVSSARRSRASSSASRPRRIFSSLASRIRSFCWARASETMRAAFSVAALIDWLAHWLRATKPRPRPTARPTSAPRTRAV